MSLHLMVVGVGGRMGSEVVRIADETPDVEIVERCAEGEPLPASGEGIDALIDFTSPEGTQAHARWCSEKGVALITGTTGLEDKHQSQVEEAAKFVPVVQAPNMSVGVNLLFDLADRATRALGPEAEIEIVETHHRHKKDAPSGTARRLGEVVAEARGTTLDAVGRFERYGMIGSRGVGEIGVMTLRGGSVVGEHTAFFHLEGERVELIHRATDRGIFARGAIRAARWAQGKEPGLYGMQDVLSAVSAAGQEVG